MGLAAFLEEATERRRDLTVYGPEPPVDLRSLFDGWNVSVRFVEFPVPVEESVLTVHESGEFVGGTSAAALVELAEPPVSDPWDESETATGYARLMDLLDDTLFTTRRHRLLLAAAREFEDRAWRLGGTLRACFTSLDVFRAQSDVYERLATERGVRVVAYVAHESPPPVSGVAVRATPTDEVERTWVVAFDGDGRDTDKCALVARKQRGRAFAGLWTYDPAIVDDLTSYLARTYG